MPLLQNKTDKNPLINSLRQIINAATTDPARAAADRKTATEQQDKIDLAEAEAKIKQKFPTNLEKAQAGYYRRGGNLYTYDAQGNAYDQMGNPVSNIGKGDRLLRRDEPSLSELDKATDILGSTLEKPSRPTDITSTGGFFGIGAKKQFTPEFEMLRQKARQMLEGRPEGRFTGGQVTTQPLPSDLPNPKGYAEGSIVKDERGQPVARRINGQWQPIQ